MGSRSSVTSKIINDKKKRIISDVLGLLKIDNFASSDFARCGSENSNRVQQALNTFKRGCSGSVAAFTSGSSVFYASQVL